jgi:DUF1009 family protein
MEPLGLVAGEGVFPLLVARGAKAAGQRVICVNLGGCAWPELRREVDAHYTVGIARVGQWIKVLKRHRCAQAIMVGRVAKDLMYGRWRYLQFIPDLLTVRLWLTDLRHDKRPGTVLGVIARAFAKEGIELMDSTVYCPEHLASPGVMTRRQPTQRQWRDIHYGWERCRTLSQLDIGQALAVIDSDVIAVEAIEGTNAMIERAGVLCRSGGWTLVKVGNTHGDMRLDVPTIGTTTIEKLHAAHAGCVVLEPGKTIILERPKVLELADRYGIAVVGYTPPHQAG